MHRDVIIGNFLVRSSGEVVLIDFEETRRPVSGEYEVEMRSVGVALGV